MSFDFSLWCDFIHRDFLESEFSTLIDSGLIQGATSNPSIFAQSLMSKSYADSIRALNGMDAKTIYESLAMADIRRAAEILNPLWKQNSANGFVSIEIDPFLCDDASKSIEEGARLYESIAMPNVMIKVPATKVGYEVMNILSRKGININATLVFSVEQARECAAALQDGYKYFAKTDSINKPQYVISVFVSRFDRAVNASLMPHLRNQMGIVNAMDCYEVIESFNQSNIRTLFASTGVKGDDLPKSYYIDGLLLSHSVNTAPLDSIKAYEKSSKVQKSLMSKENRLTFWKNMQDANIKREEISQSLLNDGIKAFCESFECLLKSL